MYNYIVKRKGVSQMRRAYVVVSELEPHVIHALYAVCHSMSRADELCLEAETEDPQHYYTWYEAIEEDD
jgi:hypothetical protein